MNKINEVLKEELEMFDTVFGEFVIERNNRPVASEVSVRNFLTQSHQNIISAFKEMVEGLKKETTFYYEEKVYNDVLNKLLSSLTEEKI